MAIGLDRLFAIICGASTIREVIAFPKTSEAKDLMCKAPAAISVEDQQYYHIHPTQPQQQYPRYLHTEESPLPLSLDKDIWQRNMYTGKLFFFFSVIEREQNQDTF